MFKYLMVAALCSGWWMSAFSATSGQCGDAPIVADTTMRADLNGRAQALSRHILDADLDGRIETTKTDVFEKYGDPQGYARARDYVQYQVCLVVMDSRTLTDDQKIDKITSTAAVWLSPPKKK